MRHILVHDYFSVDIEIMWLVIQDDIPELKQQIAKYLLEFESQEKSEKENKAE